MKLLLAGILAALTFSVAAPAVAQSIYIGPNGGVGVGIGARPYGGYYRGRDGYDGRRPAFEGRSAYRGDRALRRDGEARSDRGVRGDRF